MTIHIDFSWNLNARDDVVRALASAECDPTSGTVTITARWSPPDDDSSCTFRSLDDVRTALIELAESRLVAEVPFDGGQPVFSIDPDAIVDDLMADDVVEQFFLACGHTR